MNPKMQKLMRQLGDAINESLSDSEQIAEVISRIKSGGYDVFLVLEATIGFNKQGDDESETIVHRSDIGFRVSPQDMKFLKSLRISVDEDGDKAA